MLHVQKGFVRVAPTGDGFAIGGQHLEFLERCTLPVSWSQDDRDDAGFSTFVFLQGTLHFNTETIIRVHEVGTDQQEDDVSSIEVCINLAFPFCSCTNVTVMP